MTNPQVEDGYTRIANQIIEALARIRISGEEMQCLWVIFRKTYGWNKKSDYISFSQFASCTGLTKPSVSRVIKKLLTKKIIDIYKNDNSNVNIYKFNKHIEEWRPINKKATPLSILSKGIDKNVKESIDKNDKHKRHIKDTITKDTGKKFKKPSISQIKEYCIERNNDISPENFYDSYEAKGWMIGKNKMKDWKAAVRTWEQRKKIEDDKYL